MADAVVGTGNIWPYYASGNTPAAEKVSGDAMGKDQFLNILITQLRHQDPMQPMQDRDFIAQMAQFSALEQMMNVATEMQLLRNSLGLSSSLIGKELTWNVYDVDGKLAGTETGIADSILLKDGVQYAKVGPSEIKVSDVVQISERASDEGTEAPEESS